MSTGGGYGLLSRLYGLTIDFLHAVEVLHVPHRGRLRSSQSVGTQAIRPSRICFGGTSAAAAGTSGS